MSKIGLQNSMARELGFRDYKHLMANKQLAVANRYHYYDFRWRLILKKYQPYKVLSLVDQYIVERFHTEYEDHVFKNNKGAIRNWPKTAKNQYEYLTRRLVKRWRVIKHANRLFTIKDPNNITWFRALDLDELFKALSICYAKGKGPLRSIVYQNGLKWTHCVTAYNSKMKRGRPLWSRFDLDISLMIADKIIRTFNTSTGVWQTGGNAWALIVNKKLTVSDKTRFQDIINIVSTASVKSVSKGVYAIALFWGVGGSKAVNVIKGAYRRNNIPKWW